MFTSRVVFLATLTAGFLLAGCHTSTPGTQSTAPPIAQRDNPPAVKPGDGAQSSPSEVKIVDAAPAPGTAQALAQRATNYAHSVEPLIVHSTPTRPADAPDPSPPVLSHVPPKNESTTAVASDVIQRKAQAPAVVENPRTENSSLHTAQPSAPPAGDDAFGVSLSKRARDYPEDLSAQADDQILKLLRDEPVPDVQALAKLAPEDRELLSALIDSLTNFRNQLRQNNNMLFSQKIAPLVDLSDRLRSQAELTVPTLVVCSKAPYFGNYEKIDPARFVAGQSHTIGIYYEVENFYSQLNENHLYQTKLTEQLVLYTESSGIPEWSAQKVSYTDFSHRRRRDYFMAKTITLPSTLSIGRYLLKVTMEDQQARRIAENTVPIEIVAQ